MERPNWAELDTDILITIFLKLGAKDVLKSAGFVCRAWYKVAKDEPVLWKRIQMSKHGPWWNPMVPIRRAIDRSNGMIEEFWIKLMGDDDLLQYLCDRTSMLKSLRVILCFYVSKEGVIETALRQPLLEELEITFGSLIGDLSFPELAGKELPNLKRLKLNGIYWYDPWYRQAEVTDNNQQAYGIAKSMHQLCYLQLIGNRLTNEGLKTILEACPHLKTLDIRGCHNVHMDSDMWALCTKLTTLRLPDDSLDDYMFEAEGSHDWL